MRAVFLAFGLLAASAVLAQPPGPPPHDRDGRGGPGDRPGPGGGPGDRPGPGGPGRGSGNFRGPPPGGPAAFRDGDRGRDWQRGRAYDWNRPDQRFGGYDASRYYRDGRFYRERRLGRADRIYYGGDGRYYCRRSDGTTGLIVGGVLGGLLGNTLADRRSATLGTLLGIGGGAALGSAVDRGNVRCR